MNISQAIPLREAMLETAPYEIGVGIAATSIWTVGAAMGKYSTQIFELDSRMTGRWEGDLECKEPSMVELHSQTIHCVLVLARPIARQNSGLLYYDRQCNKSNTIVARGVDELKDYRRTNGTFRIPEFTMRFIRRFHVDLDGKVNRSPLPYILHCRFERFFTRAPKLYVGSEIHPEEGKAPNKWEGVFQKQ